MPQPRCSVALNSGRGFTLIELLVVVAIIAVLAALLFPVTQRMISAGHSTKCISNLRTIHGVALRFANENNGQVPTWGDDNEATGEKAHTFRWHQALAPMFDEAQQLFNPRNAATNPPTLKRIWNKLACPAIPNTYGFGPGSTQDNLAGENSFYITYAVGNFHDTHNRKPVPLLQVEKPSQSIYMVDGYATVVGTASRNNDVVDEGWPKKTSSHVYFPHNGRANAIMVDGHVESFEGSIPRRYFWIRDYD